MSSEQEPRVSQKETLNNVSNKEIDAIAEKLNRELESKAEKAANTQHNTENLTNRVEQLAISGKEMGRSETADVKQHPVLINKQLKDMAYSRSMTRVRKHLSLPSRLFSKAIHSKVLDKPSEVIGNTVARPSGMLGGALLATVGTSVLLWVTKHYGYSYNYLAVIMLFVLGMTFGIVTELIWKSLKRK
ncbi:MAG: hypothetical protein Q7T41_00220 [Candidatus Saccharibacteria bacterium]|nr:hypothetical protein [Candidatus Saccharibacteria bacterium]